MLGSDFIPRSPTAVADLGLLGLLSIARSHRPALTTQSPRRWMSFLPNLRKKSLVRARSTPVCSNLAFGLVPGNCLLAFCALLSSGLATQSSPSPPAAMGQGTATVHTPLPSPTVDAVRRPVCGPPPPPLSSSHSSRPVRTAAARIVVSSCPVQTVPRYTARCPPAACASSCP